MSDAILVAVIAGAVSLASSIVSMLVSAYQSKQNNNLTLYRIQKLEEKVTKHNNLVERMYEVEKKEEVIEQQIRIADHRLYDLEEEYRRENE